jgi:hypothetical protein
MASNKAFEKEAAAVKKLNTMWVCPSCGKTVHISRKHCNCHARLLRASVKISGEDPEIGPCNFEAPGLTCNDCPEDCKWCFSFGVLETNKAGFGGKDCRYNNGSVRCYCCQSQARITLDIVKADFTGLASFILKKQKGEENPFHGMADCIRDAMTRPVLNRIQQRMGEAG